MADVKISQLPTATTVADADILVINQGGVTKQATRALVNAISGILPVANGGTGVAASSGANSVVLRDANQNISANVVSEAFQTIVKSASTLTLTASSVRQYVLTGSATGQNINIPLVTTLQNGDVFYFINRGSTSITINNSDGANFANLIGSSSARIVIVDNTDNAGGFHVSYFVPRTAAWSETLLSFSGAINGATWNGNVIAHNRGGTGHNSFTDGQLLIGNTTNGALSKATLTAGSNVTITNGNGSITIGTYPAGTQYEFFEHFLSSTAPFLGNLAASNSGGTLGSNGSYTSKIGVVNLSTGTTAVADQRAAINNAPVALSIGGSNIAYEFGISLTRNSAAWLSGTTTGFFRFGFLSVVAQTGIAEPASGVYFRATSSDSIEFVTRNGNVETATATGVTLVTNTFNEFQISINSASSQVVAIIDNVVVATHTTNIPVAANRLGVITTLQRVSADATNVIASVDWIYFKATPVTPFI